ncbi:glycosyltransferase family 2 protein [Chloroflexota bacterium]
MMHGRPLVSIGMPVYNGERYLRQALDSLLAQDYTDFELIISDNASIDQTQEICLEYAAKEKRVRYYRNNMNMRAVWNFNRVFELSSREYFMWASHDDYWAPSYLRSCLSALDTSAIVLSGAVCESIKPETGEPIFTDEGFSTVGLRPRERFMRYKSTIHGGRHIGGIFYGIYRRCALARVMPIRNMIAADHLVLAELCFYGEFVTVPEPLMVKRSGGVSSSIRNAARVLGINNWFLIKCPYLVREVLLQGIIFRTDKLKKLEKTRLASWSLGNYVQVCLLRSLRLRCLKLLVLIYQAMPDWAQRYARRTIGLYRSTDQRESGQGSHMRG